MRSLDEPKTRASVSRNALVAQRTEQRFPKTISLGSADRNRGIRTAPQVNGLGIGTRPAGSCAPHRGRKSTVVYSHEYQGKRVRLLWDYALRTGNLVLRQLVLRYESEREGIAVSGRRCA